LDDYELRINADGGGSVAGEVFQFKTIAGSRTYYLEVGKFSAHYAPGDADAFRSHWKVCLLFIDSCEHDQENKVTVVPRAMESQHWQRIGVDVANGVLPKYNSSLPDAIIRSLVAAGLCARPAWVQVYHGTLATVLDGCGSIAFDDDD